MANEISCPLCDEKKYIVHKHFSIETLSKQWQNGFGFNPFLSKDLGDTITKLQCVECQLIYYTPSFLGDAEFYSTLSQFSFYYEEVKWEFDEAIKIILKHKPNSLLEIGCGNGNFLRKINNAIQKVEGIEINEKAIENCKANDLNVSSKLLNQIQEQFDAVVLFEVLEHLDNLNEILNQIIRITKKNGILIIAVPNPDGYLKEIDTVLLDMPPHHSSGWSIKTFDFIAKKYNLEKIHYGLEPLREVHYHGLPDTKFPLPSIPDSIAYPNKTIKSKISSKMRKFIEEILFNVLSPIFNSLFNRIDYLSFKLGRDKIIGQTHLIVFKKI